MSKGTQLLGTKISLISKSEIRYEGILFSLDPHESTLALAKVRMFGTENRPAENPVAARDEVFEFIIFRGQDIKDIRLCEAPAPQPTIPGGLPYDPAILQHSVPGAGALGAGALGAAGLQQPAGLAGSIMRPTFRPLGGLNPYPTLDGAAPGGPLGQLGNLMAPGLTAGLGGLAGGLGLSGAAAVAAASELPLSPHGELPPHPDHVSEGDQDLLSGVAARSNNSTPVAGASATASQGRKSPTQPEASSKDDKEQRTSSRGSGSNRRDNENYRGQRGGRRSNSRGTRGASNQGDGQRGGGRGGQGPFKTFVNNFGRNRIPMKFDEDYDFESANSKFEELKNKMGKMKIGGDTVLVLNGTPGAEGEKKENAEAESSEVVTSVPEGEASSEALVSAPEEKADSSAKPACYDKSRSFFDSISCEAVERSKGNTQRTDWRHERKLNAETFGLPFSHRGGRGYHRGGGGGGRGYYSGGNGRGGNGGYYRQNNDGGYRQNNDGYQPRGRGGYRGRGGRGNNNGNRDSDGNPGQSRGYNRRNWQQQQQENKA